MIFRHNHRRLNALDLQQFICRLGTDNGRTRKPFRRTDADGKGIPVNLCRGNGCRLRLVILHIIPEQLAHTSHIGSVPAQERCCLKGTHTGLVGKVVGIDHDTGIHGICLCCLDLNTVRDVLQHLSNHLTG